jgi:hypothetical protein
MVARDIHTFGDRKENTVVAILRRQTLLVDRLNQSGSNAKYYAKGPLKCFQTASMKLFTSPDSVLGIPYRILLNLKNNIIL